MKIFFQNYQEWRSMHAVLAWLLDMFLFPVMVISLPIQRIFMNAAFGEPPETQAVHDTSTGDTLGVIAGLIIALLLVANTDIREVFRLALVPGFIALIVFWVMVKEKNPVPFSETRSFAGSLAWLPIKFREFPGSVSLAAEFASAAVISASGTVLLGLHLPTQVVGPCRRGTLFHETRNYPTTRRFLLLHLTNLH